MTASQFNLFDRREFLAERQTGIGGSDVGSVYNLDWGCARRLAYAKTSVPEDFPQTETPEMERGTVMEHVCKMLYEKRTGRTVTLQPMARSEQYPHMIVHVDGEVTSPAKPGPGYCEFKVVNRFTMTKFRKSGIRDSYILQLQHGMIIKNYSWGSFGLLCVDPWRFEWFDVDADPEMQKSIIIGEREFWENIQQRILPPALEEVSDKRCLSCPWRKTCRGSEMAEEIKGQEKGDVISMPELAPLIQEAVEMSEIKAQAAELEEEARQAIKKAIGDAYGITAPGFRVLYPTSYPERWDTAALKGLETEAKKILASERELWDLDALEDRCTELLQIVMGLSKARKQAKPERSLRIYPVGE
jgi:predicted phage-related endonuclease